MKVFVDASALVAIVADEDDAVGLADDLDRYSKRLFSALSGWETVAALCRSYRLTSSAAQRLVNRFVAVGGLELVSIGQREFEIATVAYARYGKGHHPAGLNMGDCFAYACAKANDARLLYKSHDFVRTDLT